ncbi:MAG: quinone-dependent dihydroorotate dehydrogenase [Myxococcota bacterium]
MCAKPPPVDLYSLVGPIVRSFSAERAHDLTLWALERGLGGRVAPVEDPRLVQEIAGVRFPNPVGLAAGFDKNARVYRQMLGQGFGFVEIGSVTPKPQPGNPKPRVFRIPSERAAINRLGFNNEGIDAAAKRLEGRDKSAGVVGVNLGKNKTSEDAVADYRAGASRLGPLADYLVVNVSSPNTPGLRALQEPGALEAILDAVREVAPSVPLYLKIAPDLVDEDLADITALALGRVDGLIVTNTTIARPDSLPARFRSETGGLSGGPLFERSTEVLREVYRVSEGKLPLVGVGGIVEAEQGYKKILAGASLVQLYTGLIYAGTGLVRELNRAVLTGLERDGFGHVRDAVGQEAN